MSFILRPHSRLSIVSFESAQFNVDFIQKRSKIAHIFVPSHLAAGSSQCQQLCSQQTFLI